jgi:hypothetical protein
MDLIRRRLHGETAKWPCRGAEGRPIAALYDAARDEVPGVHQPVRGSTIDLNAVSMW